MFEAALLPSKEKIMEENMLYLNSNKWENDTMYKKCKYIRNPSKQSYEP